MRKPSVVISVMTVVLLLLSIANILFGSTHISAIEIVSLFLGNEVEEVVKVSVLLIRLPQMITALLAGAMLGVCGLLLQTLFRNPLAGPSVLGVSGGASLGVAVVMLTGVGSAFLADSLTYNTIIIIAALVGSVLVTLLLLAVSRMVRHELMLLISGMFLGYLVSSLITILNTVATPTGIKAFVFWGMGDFNGVGWGRMPLFVVVSVLCLFCSLLLTKSLSSFVLGKQYAENLGVNTHRLQRQILLLTGLMTALTTAFCGPIAFIGLAVPHIARLICNTDSLRLILPLTIICGSCVALLCNLLCVIIPGTILPLNAVTPIVGVPVILWVMLRSRR